MMKLNKLQLVSLLAVAGGLVLLTPFLYFWSQNKIALANALNQSTAQVVPAKAPLPEPKPALITGKPVRLQIPSLGIDIDVIDGAYNAKSGAWTLSRNKAHYALPTIQPNNEQGNTLIYGHYRKEVFARLHLIKPGAEVQVLTEGGHRFIYTFKNTQTVDPSNVDIFAYEGKPQLTIQTCSGAWFQNRQLFYFDFERAEAW